MAEIQRISVEDAHKRVDAGQALLVCAYDDEARCRMIDLAGSVPLTTLQPQVGSLPKNQEIIFYCA